MKALFAVLGVSMVLASNVAMAGGACSAYSGSDQESCMLGYFSMKAAAGTKGEREQVTRDTCYRSASNVSACLSGMTQGF